MALQSKVDLEIQKVRSNSEDLKNQIEHEVSVDDIKRHFSDRWWRLNHLYYITDERGNKVLFKPENREAQRELHDNLWFFNIVPKARQLGVTTFFAIFYLDQVLFGKNKSAGIIAHRQEDMKKIFKYKIRFAWDHLHPWLKEQIGTPNTDNANELSWDGTKPDGTPKHGGTIFVTMSTRSATVQFLHISEFGYICQKYPEKAEEIVAGAINSVHAGAFVSIESTAAGQEGYFYQYVMEADRMRREGRELSEMDFKLFFFPWYIDPKYSIEGSFPFEKEDLDYFTRLKDKHNIELTAGQKRWYVKKKKMMGEKMFQEFPSTLDECFQVSIEGQIFKNEMRLVYKENRIRPIAHDTTCLVDTWWDLGMDDFNVILLTQTKGTYMYFIDMYWNQGEGLVHYYDWLKTQREDKRYKYGTHHLPHDVEVRELGTGISRKETLQQLGMTNILVGIKQSPIEGIDKVRTLFNRFVFDETNCKRLHEALFNYRKEYDARLGVFKNKPRHDENSHFADPVRLIGQFWKGFDVEVHRHDMDKQESSGFFG